VLVWLRYKQGLNVQTIADVTRLTAESVRKTLTEWEEYFNAVVGLPPGLPDGKAARCAHLLARYVGGDTMTAIARAEGVSRQRVAQLLASAYGGIPYQQTPRRAVIERYLRPFLRYHAGVPLETVSAEAGFARPTTLLSHWSMLGVRWRQPSTRRARWDEVARTRFLRYTDGYPLAAIAAEAGVKPESVLAGFRRRGWLKREGDGA
jgi:hypothetical protein